MSQFAINYKINVSDKLRSSMVGEREAMEGNYLQTLVGDFETSLKFVQHPGFNWARHLYMSGHPFQTYRWNQHKLYLRYSEELGQSMCKRGKPCQMFYFSSILSRQLNTVWHCSRLPYKNTSPPHQGQNKACFFTRSNIAIAMCCLDEATSGELACVETSCKLRHMVRRNAIQTFR